MRLRDRAKKIRVVYALNAYLKCVELKLRIALLERKYSSALSKTGFNYLEREAIDAFIQQHRLLRPDYVPRTKGALRIVWVGASQSQDESGFLQSLNRIGNVSIFRNAEGGYGPLGNCESSSKGMTLSVIRHINDKSLLQCVEQALMHGGVDVLIGQMWSHLYSAEALQKIRGFGIPVIVIAMDDRLPAHWSTRDGIRMGAVGLGAGVDMFLTTAPEICSWYGVEGYSAVFWPLASDPELFGSDSDSERDIDVLFIGNRYGVRGKIVDYLTQRGIAVNCYGHGWPNGYVDAKENINLSKRAKIILGVGTVGHCSDVFTLKLRDFDALMAGALYVTNRNPDLLKLFSEGQEIICYSKPGEAYEKINFYLNNPRERLNISKSGHAAALSKHTWDFRLSDTLCRLGLLQDSFRTEP